MKTWRNWSEVRILPLRPFSLKNGSEGGGLPSQPPGTAHGGARFRKVWAPVFEKDHVKTKSGRKTTFPRRPPATRKAGGSHHRYAERPLIPCATVLTAHSALSRQPGFFASVARRHVYALDPDVGGSGSHALAVRDHAARHAARPRPSHSTPTFVTVATPLIPRVEQNGNIGRA